MDLIQLTPNPPGKRFRDAIDIQGGACNPRGIARSLLTAIEESANECADTASICADPAVRLIAHQLAFLLKTYEIDMDTSEYARLLSRCEAGR